MRNINIKNDNLLSKKNIISTNLNSYSIKHIFITNIKDEQALIGCPKACNRR